MKTNRKLLIGTLVMLCGSSPAFADSLAELNERANDASNVLKEVVSIKDNTIPVSLLNKATCVATIPNVIRVGFVFGARYGQGLVSCRTPLGWSKPAFINAKGGSWGFQIGIESIDLVLIFTKDNAIERFSRDNFTIGVDANVAAGPLGRDAQAGTDYKLNSEIYSYSKAKGLFAGLAIEGTILDSESSENAIVYGSQLSARDILTQTSSDYSATGMSYVSTLKYLVP